MVRFAKERSWWIRMRISEIIAFILMRIPVVLGIKRYMPFEQQSK